MMRYRKREHVNPRHLYKGFHIVPNSKGRYDIYTALLEWKADAGTLSEAWRFIDNLFQRRKAQYG